MKNCSRQFVSYVNKQEGLAVIDMKDTFTRFTNDVIATTAFGVSCNSLDDPDNEFFLMGKDATNFSGIRNLKFFLYALSPALMKVRSNMFKNDIFLTVFFAGIGYWNIQ